MITTGLKQVIVNKEAQVAYDASGDVLEIVGVGKFGADKVRKMALLDTKAVTMGQYRMSTANARLNYSIGDLITVALYFTSYRDEGEYSSDRSVGTDPWILQFTAATTVGVNGLATDITAAINGASAELKERYHVTSAVAATSNVTVTMSKWNVVLRTAEVNGVGGTPLFRVRCSIVVAGDEGRGLPQFMEESIKTSTKQSKDTYGLQNDMQLNMNTTYIEMYIELGYETLGNTNTSVINGGPTPRIQKTQVWLDSAVFTDAVLDTVGIVGATAATADNLMGDVIASQGVTTSATEDAYADLTIGTYEDVL